MASSKVCDASFAMPKSPPPSSPAMANSKQSLWEEPQTHQNRLSKRQMESLVAFCDTLLPSLDPPSHNSDDDSGDLDGVAAFYRTSASMAGIPERLGEAVSGGMVHPQMMILRLALLLLSTWYGTLLLCGWRSLSPQFPFVRRFALLEQNKREEIVYSWSSSSFRHLRMLYTCIKCTTMRLYFAQVDEKHENPSWKAIGYCGPDPTHVDHSQTTTDHRETLLQSALLHLNHAPEIISGKLRQAGFPSPTFTPTNKPTLHCDAVIIGSGSGGSVAAGVLAAAVAAGVLAAAGHKILLIEKGHFYSTSELSLLEGPTCSAMYEGGGIVATDDVSIFLLAGATVGGGSTINWSASIPTPDIVRREWRHLRRLDLFGSEAYDRALEAVSRRLGVQSGVKVEGFNNEVLRRGCKAAGYDVADVGCNAPPDHYCGWCQWGCKDGKKKSALVTWLDDMARSGNGFILPGCRAVEVIKVRGKQRPEAAGVVVESSAGLQFTIRSKVTVVACGALNTPRLLKRSGLRNKHIGRNLHLHPVAMAWGYFPETSGWPEKMKRSYEGGILTSMSRPKDSNNVILQTPSIHPGIYAALTPWTSASDFRYRMRRFARIAHIFALVRDQGSGAVDYPGKITHRLAPDDEKGLKEGLEAAIRVLEAAGAEEVGTQWVGGDKGRGRDGVERVLNGVRKRRIGDLRTPMCSAHQMGSCRMGMNEEEGAVGPNGEVWEMEGLFVVDTSVFPTALGVNPMVTVQALAYCISKSVDELLRRKMVDSARFSI
ncbi:long-chain-alcohol oxidase FAO4A [Phalaenopsis equestris]|uniref:long-chain-alcohol oxidase FAO4A n=1 Tax=Phalaenopsis equestris TaxID=78828 RepID=UPI0009E1B71B|nr:long-chain-alcohol oxidase FAO4A [Phalaenopsis equestris]